MEYLQQLDEQLFVLINTHISNSFFDYFFPLITDFHKIPLLVFGVFPILLFLIFKKLQWSKFKFLMVALILSVMASDLFVYRVLKPAFGRERPSVRAERYDGSAAKGVALPVVLRTSIHVSASFPSNHASNNFAAAVVLASFLPGWNWVFYLIAFLVSISRVYIGVHFPGDVVVGALVGVLIGHAVLRATKALALKMGKQKVLHIF